MYSCGTFAPSSTPANTSGLAKVPSSSTFMIAGNLILLVIGSDWMIEATTDPTRSSSSSAVSTLV